MAIRAKIVPRWPFVACRIFRMRRLFRRGRDSLDAEANLRAGADSALRWEESGGRAERREVNASLQRRRARNRGNY